MKFKLHIAAMFAVAAYLIPSAALAVPACTGANPGDAPAGCIFDLDTTTETGGGNGTVLSSYTFFTTSFVATASSEYVSFAFRETPAFFSFDDGCVVAGTTAVTSSNCVSNSGNLLADPAFQGSAYGDNCGHEGGGPCPPGWGAWIQSVDLSAIGQIATTTETYGCGNPGAPPTGSATANWWCDGSVQGYDAIYQQLSGLTVGNTYQIGWWLDDNSGGGITETPGSSDQVDMLVYAGTQLPVGAIPIGTPEPGTFALIGLGLTGLGFAARRRRIAMPRPDGGTGVTQRRLG